MKWFAFCQIALHKKLVLTIKCQGEKDEDRIQQQCGTRNFMFIYACIMRSTGLNLLNSNLFANALRKTNMDIVWNDLTKS